jgi:dUTPase
MLFQPVLQANFIEVSELSPTARGEGGFGHSGKK